MKTRTDLLNFLAEKYKLQRYLEIGLQDPAQNFYKINCAHKVSVDPDPKAKALYEMTSDEYFNKAIKFQWIADLIFIDGMHTAEQVNKDFLNAMKILSPEGVIVFHDTNPETYERTIVPRPTPSGPWNGDVYKFAGSLYYRNIPNIFTVDIDNGCTVLVNDDFSLELFPEYDPKEIEWSHFDKHRKKLLKLISWQDFVNL